MKRAVVSSAVGEEWLEIASITWPRMRGYAHRHGADFISGSPDAHHSRPVPWLKLPFIASALADYDEVLWLDADVYVQRDDRSIFEAASGDSSSHAMCRQFCPSFGEHFNTGVWLCRLPLIPAIVTAAMEDDCIHHPWWEQAAIARQLWRYPAFPLGEEWNHWIGSPQMPTPPMFRHACGLHGKGEQLAKIKEWASQCS